MVSEACLFIHFGWFACSSHTDNHILRHNSVPIMFSWFGRSSEDTTRVCSEHVEDGMLEVRVVKDFYNRLGVV